MNQVKPHGSPTVKRVLVGVISRLKKLSDFYENACKKETRFADWKERQLRGFIWHLDLYAKDLFQRYETDRIDLVAQAMRNLMELNVWVRYCELSPQEGKRFFDDGYRDMRDMTEALQKLDTGSDIEPKQMVEDLLVELKTKAPSFGVDDYEAAYIRVNDAAGKVGTQARHAAYYKVASKFAHPTAMLLFRSGGSDRELLDALYESGVRSAGESLRELEQIVRTTYQDFIA